MDLPLTRLYSARAAPRGSPVPLAAFPSPLPLFAASTAHRTPLTPPPIVSPISPAADRLDDLMREQAVLAHLKANVPMIWEMVESEIHSLHLSRTPSRAQRLPHHARLPAHSSPMPPAAPRAALPVALCGARGAHAPGGAGARKRVKLPVPAEKYPDYNFVGRLLGPRGTTLKKLERDTGCKIMIRGRGSIRKDKELEVRGKAGWEHVFNESLHVVIEVCDAVDDSDAARVLTRAKEMVELLLVPMPEDRDTLKRQQLRVLAILNGTFRASDAHRCSPAQSPRPAAAGHAAVFTAGSGRAAAAHLIPSGGDFGIIGSAVGIGSAVSIGSALSIGETPSM